MIVKRRVFSTKIIAHLCENEVVKWICELGRKGNAGELSRQSDPVNDHIMNIHRVTESN